MTAREKFNARLKELGLYEEWKASGDKAGKFLEDGTIVIMVHYDWDPEATYDELHFPSYDEMWKNEAFKKECASSFFEHDDDEFVAGLARWLEYGPGCHYECPLYAVDAYFPGSGLETDCVKFEDDPEIELYGREWQEVVGPFKPQDGKDWLVATLDGGALWMNNEEGNVILAKPDGHFLISAI